MANKFNTTVSPFLFLGNDNSGGGGGGGITSLPISDFVFVNILGNDATGVREDFSKPFKTLNGAKNSALSGDTIYVYGGVYNETNSLQKDGVKWHFVGSPTLNLSAVNVWHDNGGAIDIQVYGNANINHVSIGQFILIQNVGTTLNVNFNSVRGLGNQIFMLDAGSGVVNVTDVVQCTSTNNCFRNNGDSNYIINVRNIINTGTVGLCNCIHAKNSGLFTGHNIYNVENVKSQGTNVFQPIRIDYATYSGKITVNCSGIIKRDSIVNTDAQSNNTVMCLGGNLIINGDIDGNGGLAIQISGNQPKTLIHNGNAFNNGTLPVLGYGVDPVAFWNNANSNVTLNGLYTSINDNTLTVGGANAKTFVNGKIINSSAGIPTSGINIDATNGELIIESLVIVLTNPITTALCVTSSVANNIKIFRTFGSNVNASPNISNIIAGTSLVIDTDYE